MVKARSPGYPSISLGEAVDKITLVYKNDYQNKIPRPVVAQHAGYNSMNGRALSVLASLSKYGLLEGRGEENWVSDLALQIIAHAPKSQERAKAIQEAADLPDLFREISERFPGGVSEVALKSYLLTRKFIPDAADTVARCYRETKQFVLDELAGYVTVQDANEERDTLRLSGEQVIDKIALVGRAATQSSGYAAPQVSGLPPPAIPAQDSSQPPAGMRRAVFDLAEGEVTLQFPDEISPESVEDLEGYLEVFMKKTRRAAGLPPK